MMGGVETLKVPRLAVPLILLQRPMLQRHQRASARLGIPLSLKIGIESILRHRAVRYEFAELMEEEYQSIRTQLPVGPTRVLDIGCGLAAIDALLFMHYGRRSDLQFFLLDRSEWTRPPRYGFSTRAEFYTSLEVATELLRANGVGLASVHQVEVAETAPCSLPAADLIISLASWGFHYPVSTYLEPVWNAMEDGGTLILDIRAGLGEEQALARRFTDIQAICELWEGKAIRYRVKKGHSLA
jgi:hypothetical protein